MQLLYPACIRAHTIHSIHTGSPSPQPTGTLVLLQAHLPSGQPLAYPAATGAVELAEVLSSVGAVRPGSVVGQDLVYTFRFKGRVN